MYKVVGKRLLAMVLCVCMVMGMPDASLLAVEAADDVPGSIRNCDISLSQIDFVYNGEQQRPDVSVKYKGNDVSEEYYTLTYKDNNGRESGNPEEVDLTNCGMKTITIAGQNGCTGSDFESYNILAKSIKDNNLVIKLGEEEKLYADDDPIEQKYDEYKAIKPSIKIIDGSRELVGILAESEEEARENEPDGVDGDFYYYYQNNNAVGTEAEINIFGYNNYTGEKTLYFTIAYKTFKDDCDIDIRGYDEAASSSSKGIFEYDEEKERTPSITIMDDSYELILGADYTVKYLDEDNLDEDDNFVEIKPWPANPGNIIMRIEGMGNYTGSIYDEKYSIIKNIKRDDIKVEFDNPVYTGGDIEPKITVTDRNGAKTLVKGIDYTLDFSYISDKINVQKGLLLYVRGRGCYYGSTTIRYDINARNISDTTDQKVDISLASESLVYSGSPQKPEVVVKIDNKVIDPDSGNYSLDWKNNEDAGTGTASVTITGTKNLTGNRTKTFTITPKSLSDNDGTISVTLNPDNITYTGSSIPSSVVATVKYTKGANVKTLVKNEDYTISWSEEIKAGESIVTITGKGKNYINSTTKPFNINRQSLDDGNTTIEWITGKKDYEGTYTGSEIRPTVIVRRNGIPLNTGDYRVTYNKNINVEYENGSVKEAAEVKVEGLGNYMDTVTKTFTIQPKDISDIPENANDIFCSMVSTSLIYANKQITPEIKLQYMPGTSPKTLGVGDYIIGYGENLNVIYDDAGNVTKGATINITGIGNYSGTRIIDFAILPVDLSENGEKLRLDVPQGVGDETFYAYKNGTAVTPASVSVTAYYTFETGEKVLIPVDASGFGDYTLTYSGEKGIGKVDIKVTGNGNYVNSVTMKEQYHIKGDLTNTNANTEINTIEQVFMGVENTIEPGIEMSAWGKDLIEKTNYWLGYSDNCEPGTAKVKIYMEEEGDYFLGYPGAAGGNDSDGNYLTTTFQIVKKNLGDDKGAGKVAVALTGYEEYRYNGKEIEPVPVLTYNGKEIESSRYTYSYTNNTEASENTEAGKATVTITANNSDPYFTGSIEETFIIEKRVLTNTTVSIAELDETKVNLKDYIYKNTAFEFESVTASYSYTDDNDKVITFNKESGLTYDVEYRKNHEVGNATLVIVGNGNFTGTVTKGFKLYGDLAVAKIENIDSEEFSGLEIKPDLEVTYYGNPINPIIDYEPTYTNNINATDAAVATISTGTSGLYINSNSKKFTITQIKLQDALDDGILTLTGLDEDGYPYINGTPLTPKPTVRYNDCVDLIERVPEEAVETRNTEEVVNDYILTHKNNENVPAKDATKEKLPTIIITAPTDSVNFTGSAEKTFIINPRNIGDSVVTAEDPVGVIQDRVIQYTEKLVGKEIIFEDLNIYYNYSSEGGVKKELILGEEDDDGQVEEIWDYKLSYHKNAEVGQAYITVEGNGNYIGERNFYFDLNGNLQDAATDVKDIVSKTYNAQEITQTFTVTYGGQTLNPGSVGGTDGDYGVTYKNNKNVASSKDPEYPPTVIITGRNHFAGSEIEIPFDITPCDLSKKTDTADITVTGLEAGFMYTGSAIEPDKITEIKLYHNSVEPVEQDEYEIIDYRNNINGADKDSDNPPCIIIEGKNKNYINTMEVPFTIKGIAIDDTTMVKIDPVDDQYYTGSERKPSVTLTRINAAGEAIGTLEKGEDKDYTLEYENFTNAAVSTAGANAPTIIIKGKNNYSGTKHVNYNILKREIIADDSQFSVSITNQKFIGGKITPSIASVTIRDLTNSVTLKEGDFELSAGNSCTNIGPATVIIKGSGNYSGTITGNFTITAKNIADPDVQIANVVDKTYNTKAQTQKPIISWNGIDLVDTQNYELSYEGNVINAGPSSVTIKGKGNYDGSTKVYFTIEKKELSESEFSLSDIASQTYIAAGVEPEPTVSFVNAGEGINETLTVTRDYSFSYLENKKVGVDIATVRVTGAGNYTGYIEKKFSIVADISLVSVAAIGVQEYTGSEVAPLPVVTLGQNELSEGTDYELAYTNNTEEGTATITIFGIGNYGGQKVVTFIICRDFSDEVEATGFGASYVYTGKAITPVPGKVTAFEKTLRNGTDYTLSYSNNIAAGKAKVTVTGKGSYKGAKEYEFLIEKRNISQCTVSAITSSLYTGKSQAPAVAVKYGSTSLSKGADYSVVYVNNLTPGRAKAIISGTGTNFTGSTIATFDISLMKVSNTKAVAKSTSKITLSWSKSSGANGYEIFNTANKRVARVQGTSYTISGLKAGATYNYKVRAYVIRNGQFYYSDFAKTVKAATKPAKPVITVKSMKLKQASISWKSVSGASGYELYRSTKKGSGYRKVATTTRKSYTDKNLKSNKKYFYRARAYKVIGGNKNYSGYSTVKYVTIK